MVRSLLPESQLPGAKRQRVAVIGLGMAGATTAHLLAQKHDVVAIEALPQAGLHYHSIADGDISFDVPLRAMSPHYYPNLFNWYRAIGVDLASVNYQSTGSDAQSGTPYFRYSNLILAGCALSWPTLSRGTVWQTLVIVFSYIWLVFHAAFLLATDTSGSLAKTSMGAFLQKHRYASTFVDRFFLPVMSTLLSCSYEQVLGYPAELILAFFSCRMTTFFTGWWRLRLGVRAVSDRLLKGVDCRYNCRVARIERVEGCTAVRVEFEDGTTELFDYVVLATDAPVARRMLVDPSRDEALLLNAVSSYSARIVAHTDAGLMPADRSAWSGLNYFSLPEDPAAARTASSTGPHRVRDPSPRDASMTTACMTRFGMAGRKDGAQADAAASPRSAAATAGDSEPAAADVSFPASPTKGTESNGGSSGLNGSNGLNGNGHRRAHSNGGGNDEELPVFQTWNPYREPREGTLIRESFMSRAVWTVDGLAAFDDACAAGAQGSRRVWFAGSYCSRGITLLEQACTSGLDVALDFGVPLPFQVERQPRYFVPFVALGAALGALGRVLALLRWIVGVATGMLFMTPGPRF